MQHVGRGWYLVTTDGEGMYGNEQRGGGPGVGYGCEAPEPRVADGQAVRYQIVGTVPKRYAGTPPGGYVCGRCNRAMVGYEPDRS